MMLSLLLAIFSGSVIGLLLGATGGGGSLLAIPLLVYVLGVPAQQAALLSLIVVGLSALVGAWHKSRQQRVRGVAAIVFSVTGAAGAWMGAYGHELVTEGTVLTLFGFLMIGVSGWNLSRLDVDEEAMNRDGCARAFSVLCVGRALAIGFGIGMLTGFFGVGGGFLIVPALTLIMGFPGSLAVGTSLLIIALMAAGGILGHLQSVTLDWVLFAGLLLGSLGGVLYGSRVSSKCGDRAFRRGIGILTGSTGGLMVLVNIFRLFKT